MYRGTVDALGRIRLVGIHEGQNAWELHFSGQLSDKVPTVLKGHLKITVWRCRSAQMQDQQIPGAAGGFNGVFLSLIRQCPPHFAQFNSNVNREDFEVLNLS